MIERSRVLSVQRRTMLHPFLMAALLILLVSAHLAGLISSQIWPLFVAAAAGLFCIIECRLAGSSWAHPRILVFAYVIMACTIPPVYFFFYPESVVSKKLEISFRGLLSPQTPFLMAATILATGVGLSLQRFIPRRISAPPASDLVRTNDSSSLARHRIGRLVLIATSIPIFLRGLLFGLSERAASQLVFGMQSALWNFAQFALQAAVVVIYSSRLQLGWNLGKATLDHVMFALAIVGYLLIGSRNIVLSLVLMLFILKQSIKETKLRNVLVPIIAITVLFAWTARYRSGPSSQDAPFTLAGVWDAFLTDLCSVSATTGAVHSLVPETHPFTLGATLIADLVRMLPSPIAIAVFGQPTTTGSFKFRQLLEYDNPLNGYGFSLPAFGYLDFGLFGLIGVMVLCGWLLASLWRQFDPYRGEALALAYLLLAARFPMYLRSDVLALLKGFLYPLALIWIIIALSKWGKSPTSAANHHAASVGP